MPAGAFQATAAEHHPFADILSVEIAQITRADVLVLTSSGDDHLHPGATPDRAWWRSGSAATGSRITHRRILSQPPLR
jgi:hypothetical protein